MDAASAELMPDSTPPAPAPRPDYGREGIKAFGSFAVVSVVVLGAMQLVPVPHDNLPVQTTVQWDSPQTQELWDRACADGHSNETRYP